jgi:pyruvate ferredoxin oxidoreductase beta subunit
LMRKGRIPKQKTTIIGMGGDGATADIGLQALSGALERGHDFVYICLDNEAYMNTGVQRSSSTPYGAMTTTTPPGELGIGQQTWKKNIPAIAVAHGIPYVATAAPFYYIDLMNKAKKAAMVEGPAYLHVFAPCPTGWRLAPERAVEISRLAVQTNVFPLYEVIDGRYVVTKKIKKPKPVEEYLNLQGRFRHLSQQTIKQIQDRVNREYEALLEKSAASEAVEEAEQAQE